MQFPPRTAVWLSGLLIVLAGILGVSAWEHRAASRTLVIEMEGASLRANGHSLTRLLVTSVEGHNVDARRVSLEILSGGHRASKLPEMEETSL